MVYLKKYYIQVLFVLFLFHFFTPGYSSVTGTKSIYVPSSFNGMDLNNTASQWCYARSKQSDNFIVFWESGYGLDPKTTSNASYRVDVDALLNLAETSFTMYRDSLKFIFSGNSKTDTYKMIILLYYSTTWQASGSGVDNMIGLLSLSANAAQAMGVTVAHEVGHCFQYQVHCDGHPGGWMYGFGSNGSGGNCWWEQCAQWQAFKVFPNQQFTDYNFGNYLKYSHKNIIHETPRYASYFIQDYWTFLHGIDFIGRLWRESQYPEDPIEAYKRLTSISQTQLNDQMYDCAARFATWDIPALKNFGNNYIDAREQTPLTLNPENYWVIDSTKCIENYGYNIIRLNVPETDTVIKVHFQGLAKTAGFRDKNYFVAGWRYGFVALLKNGTRIYSAMRSPGYNLSTSSNPKDSLTFTCPANCSRLWLVVTGAPSVHWRHAWDDNDSNDEQWPYQVKFENTNLYGVFNFSPEDIPHNDTLIHNLTLVPVTVNTNPYPSTPIQPNWERVCKAFCLPLSDIKQKFGTSILYCAVNPNNGLNYTSTATHPGHWFNNTGYVTNWGNNSFIFSEFKLSNLTFNIGQYPNQCKNGDKYTIRQALVYNPPTGSSVKVLYVFNITISNVIPTRINTISEKLTQPVINTLVNDILYLNGKYENVIIRNLMGKIVLKTRYNTDIYLGHLPHGVYLVTVNGITVRILKK